MRASRGSVSPLRKAMDAASVRVAAPGSARMWETWTPAVLGEIRPFRVRRRRPRGRNPGRQAIHVAAARYRSRRRDGPPARPRGRPAAPGEGLRGGRTAAVREEEAPTSTPTPVSPTTAPSGRDHPGVTGRRGPGRGTAPGRGRRSLARLPRRTGTVPSLGVGVPCLLSTSGLFCPLSVCPHDEEGAPQGLLDERVPMPAAG